MILIANDFWHDINIILTLVIATNMTVLLTTAFVLQGGEMIIGH